MSLPVPVGTVIAERYRVDGVIGEGGMGVVVLATHLVLQQKVAIKFLRHDFMGDAEAVQRFVREARAAAKVRSEHVVDMHDVATLEDGTPYIVMEYIEGQSLATILASRGPLRVGEAVRYTIEACEALAETHAAGIVHGDLKPDNIYVTGPADGSGRVKLLDFGISKIVGDRSRGPALGTPSYMAPEQIASGTADPRSDLWSLGAVLYEMLAGEPPFGVGTAEEISARVVSGKTTPIARADVPDRLKNAILRCLSKDAALRYASALEFAFALEDYAPVESSVERVARAASRNSVPQHSQRLVPTVVVRRRGRRRAAWMIAAAGGVAIAAIGLVGLGLAHRRARTIANALAAGGVRSNANANANGSLAASASPSPSPDADADADASASASSGPNANANANASAVESASAGANARTRTATSGPARRPNDGPRADDPAPATATAAALPPRVVRPRMPARPAPAPAHAPAIATTPPTASAAAEGDRFGTRK